MAATVATAVNSTLAFQKDSLPLPGPAVREQARPNRTRAVLWIVAGAFCLTAGGLGYRWWMYSLAHVSTDNAYVTGTIHTVGSRVAGTVSELLLLDNQRVTPGTPLLKLDSRDFDLRVQQASSQVVQAGALVSQSEAQLHQARAQAAQTEARTAKEAAELEKARLDFERARHLTEGTNFVAISRQEFDATKAAFEVAQASVKVAQADLQSASAFVDAVQAAQAVAQAQRQSAEVKLAEAELERSYTSIVAPVCGVVGRKNVEVGQRVQAGQPLAAIVGEDKWIVANFKETQLARLRVGQPVSIRLDAIPGRVFRGRVDSFSPAAGAQFALLPPDNATGNFTRVVQRVPVKINFDPEAVQPLAERIAPGLSAVVDVKVLE